jgi:hypothetical protein
MSYLATVTNSVIDTANIKNLLVQGESTHPQIVFSLSPTLTGLTWYVRATYLSFNLTTESSAITPVEGEAAVTVTWDVDASFTTLYGAMQLVLVGLSGETTNVRAVGYVNVARDWSGETQGAITLDLFEQLMAQAETTIAKYPYVDETTGNWFNWNPSLGAFEDTGVHAQGIQGIQGETGATGAGVASGGTTGQALVKASGDDYDTEWADVSKEVSATFASGSWTGASAPYSQAVTVAGVTTTGKPPIIDVVLSDTYATAMLELNAYNLVYKFKVTADNTITAYAISSPTQAFDIHVKLVW